MKDTLLIKHSPKTPLSDSVNIFPFFLLHGTHNVYINNPKCLENLMILLIIICINTKLIVG